MLESGISYPGLGVVASSTDHCMPMGYLIRMVVVFQGVVVGSSVPLFLAQTLGTSCAMVRRSSQYSSRDPVLPVRRAMNPTPSEGWGPSRQTKPIRATDMHHQLVFCLVSQAARHVTGLLVCVDTMVSMIIHESSCIIICRRNRSYHSPYGIAKLL